MPHRHTIFLKVFVTPPPAVYLTSSLLCCSDVGVHVLKKKVSMEAILYSPDCSKLSLGSVLICPITPISWHPEALVSENLI